MSRLTEEMVIARSRASDLASIKKLNCWGSDLADITLLRRMLSVEVLSLSVNKINSLSDFQYCRNLQELYVRKNDIRDINEVCYLQELPNLKCLWLADNPCADISLYRPTVLKALPRLQKLDNIAVEPEEVQDALRRGLDLYHPEDNQHQPSNEYENSSSSARRKVSNHSHQSSPPDSPQGSPEQCWNLRSETPVHHQQQSPSNGHERSPPRRLHRQPSDRDMEIGEGTGMRRGPSGLLAGTPNDEDIGYYDNDRRNANNCEQAEYGYGRQVMSYSSAYESPGSQGDEDQQQYDRLCRQQMQQSQQPGRPTGLHLHPSGKQQPSSRPNVPRPKTRSNVLSAILCLLKELDYPSLEVVEMAVRSRMDEFED